MALCLNGTNENQVFWSPEIELESQASNITSRSMHTGLSLAFLEQPPMAV